MEWASESEEVGDDSVAVVIVRLNKQTECDGIRVTSGVYGFLGCEGGLNFE